MADKLLAGGHKMTLPSSGSILKIQDPQSFWCRVWGYTFGHSEMAVEARPKTDIEGFFLLFTDVRYFAGPLQWYGVDFRVGTAEEQDAIYRRYHRRFEGKEADPLLRQLYGLYVIDQPGQRVEILSGGMLISEGTEPPFQYEAKSRWKTIHTPRFGTSPQE
jgi:hypothetical protein